MNIVPVDINTSKRAFTLDAKKNLIHFGLEAVKGIKKETISKILDMAHCSSLQDFIAKTGADVTSIVALIKCGAFDSIAPRDLIVNQLAALRADVKDKLNGQNLMMLLKKGFWPDENPEYLLAKRVFGFMQYLKKSPNGALVEYFGAASDEWKNWYQLDGRSCAFLDEMNFEHDGLMISKAQWKTFYDRHMAPVKQYIQIFQEELLEKVNSAALQEWKDKYFPGGDAWAQWEIETMGVCFAEHPMKNVQNVSCFEDLPREPEIATLFQTKQGRTVPLYRLTMICGICIAQDKLHHSITLLTSDGPVEIKFRREQFASYSKQVSQMVDGKKKIIERSWFSRGTPLLIHGMRQDDQFIAKTYKNSPMKHTVYKITEISPAGKLEVQKARKTGVLEEDNED